MWGTLCGSIQRLERRGVLPGSALGPSLLRHEALARHLVRLSLPFWLLDRVGGNNATLATMTSVRFKWPLLRMGGHWMLRRHVRPRVGLRTRAGSPLSRPGAISAGDGGLRSCIS